MSLVWMTVLAQVWWWLYVWFMSHIWDIKWVVSHIWRIHVAHSFYMWHESSICVTRFLSHIWISHVTHMNESCHTYEQVVLHVACHTCEPAVSHKRMGLVTHMSDCTSGYDDGCRRDSRLTYEWVMSQIWISRVTRINESCHTYEWVMSHV